MNYPQKKKKNKGIRLECTETQSNGNAVCYTVLRSLEKILAPGNMKTQLNLNAPVRLGFLEMLLTLL